MTDSELIAYLGGPTKVASLLLLEKDGGVQRVQNWITRGIPSKIKLDFPHIFLRPDIGMDGAPEVPQAPADTAQPAINNVAIKAQSAVAIDLEKSDQERRAKKRKDAAERRALQRRDEEGA